MNATPDLFTQPVFEPHTENNRESESYYATNLKKFNRQAQKVYLHLIEGKRITGDIARELYGIKHLPRRIADLRAHEINVQDKRLPNGCKEYFIG